jgi:hypothetical protein
MEVSVLIMPKSDEACVAASKKAVSGGLGSQKTGRFLLFVLITSEHPERDWKRNWKYNNGFGNDSRRIGWALSPREA